MQKVAASCSPEEEKLCFDLAVRVLEACCYSLVQVGFQAVAQLELQAMQRHFDRQPYLEAELSAVDYDISFIEVL